MIPVPPPPEPPRFDADVREPGRQWLASGSKAKPPGYWREVLPELATAFCNRCGYTAMWDLQGTVDHFAPQHRDRQNLYEWDNLRYASQWINSSKQDRVGILDPYEVGEGWFEIQLPSLQLVAAAGLPPDERALVQSTLNQLPIGDDERIIRQRHAWLIEYEQGHVTLEGLYTFAPLLAAAIERQAGGRKAGKKKAGKKKAGRKTATKLTTTNKKATANKKTTKRTPR